MMNFVQKRNLQNEMFYVMGTRIWEAVEYLAIGMKKDKQSFIELGLTEKEAEQLMDKIFEKLEEALQGEKEMISEIKTGERIKSRRVELEMSQSELAEKMGYADKSMISQIEKGKVDLSQSKIMKFAEVLNTTPMYVFGLKGDKK